MSFTGRHDWVKPGGKIEYCHYWADREAPTLLFASFILALLWRVSVTPMTRRC